MGQKLTMSLGKRSLRISARKGSIALIDFNARKEQYILYEL